MFGSLEAGKYERLPQVHGLRHTTCLTSVLEFTYDLQIPAVEITQYSSTGGRSFPFHDRLQSVWGKIAVPGFSRPVILRVDNTAYAWTLDTTPDALNPLSYTG